MELLDITTRSERGRTIVSLAGQVDVATAPQARQALIEAQHDPAGRVVLDLRDVEFLDSMGLGVIMGGLKRARTHDGEFVLVCDRGRLLRLFEVTRLDRIVPIYASVEQALAE